MSDMQKLFEFTTYLQGFKWLERFVGQYFWRDYVLPQRFESDADHSWRMAMMLTILEPQLSKKLDFKKAMTMALIHDLPELIAGDPSPLGASGTGADSHAYNRGMAESKFEREKAAAQKIFGMLPEAQQQALYATWLEFEEKKSYEAQVVRAIDKLEGKFQALEYTGGTMFKDHFDFTMKYGVDTFAADPATAELGQLLLNKLSDSFKEYDGTLTKNP